MAFAARNDDGWRLCLRKGKTIFFVKEKWYGDHPIEFRNQAGAKACADELNEHWDAYAKLEKNKGVPDWDFFVLFLEIILKHDGLSADDVKRIKETAIAA